MGLVAPRNAGSSQTRARTRVPCIGRWILNHCATREALKCSLIYESCVDERQGSVVPISGWMEIGNWVILKLHPIIFAHWYNWCNSTKGSLFPLSLLPGSILLYDAPLRRYSLSILIFHNICVLHYYYRELSRCWKVSSWDNILSEQTNNRSHHWRK